MSRIDSRSRTKNGRSRRPIQAVSLAGTLLVLGIGVQSASAVFSEPPPLPHGITAFPDRDFVAIEGYQPSTDYTIRILRNGVTIGTAQGTTDVAGLLEANHPGGVCWQGTTPNIIANDKVVVTEVGAPADTGDAMTVQDVHAEQAVEVGTNVVVHGTSNAADGSARELGSVEQRIVNPGFRDIGLEKRDIRAILGGTPPDGTLVPDPIGPDNPAGDHWTATYTGLDDAQRDAAVAGQTRVLAWQDTNAAGDRLGVTIHEVGEINGPGFGGCPQGSDYAVTGSSHPAVTKAMQDAASPLTLSGVSQDASAVDVTLTDGTTSFTVPATTPQPATGAQTWSATFSADQLAGLQDGTLTASGSYTVADPVDPAATTTLNGPTKTLAKDTVAPGDTSATPGPGVYLTSQAVSITSPDEDAVVHFTMNGANPTAKSAAVPAQLSITSSVTVKAIAVDPVGNTSAVTPFAYVIGTSGIGLGGGAGAGGAGAGGGGGLIGVVTGSGLTAIASDAPAGSAARSLALERLAGAIRVKETKAQTQGLSLTMQLAAGTEVVRIRVLRKTGKTLKILSDGYKAPGKAGKYKVSQSHLQLRKLLRKGNYEFQVTPGLSKSELGKTALLDFKVV